MAVKSKGAVVGKRIGAASKGSGFMTPYSPVSVLLL